MSASEIEGTAAKAAAQEAEARWDTLLWLMVGGAAGLAVADVDISRSEAV